MPVILPEQHLEQWLDPSYKDADQLKKFLLPYPPKKMKAHRVSSFVSNPRNEGVECMKQVEG